MTTRSVIALFAAAGIGSGASASIVFIGADMGASEHSLGDFDGSIQYDFLGGTDGALTVSLTNTSDADNGGFLTGFVFNTGAFTVTLDLASATHPFLYITPVNGQPYGSFAHGATLDGNFQGGGSPADGIAVGDTGTFTFDLSSADAGLLEALTFLTGPNDYNFLVRFRGFEDGGSDKVPALLIPTPGAVALLGMAGIVGTSRRRRA
jgi:MYXO-CTERM domain-containing protein